MDMELLRRRNALIGKVDTYTMLYPDAYMIAFDCNANTTFQFMYEYKIIRYILDGNERVLSSGVNGVTPTTSGTHILYFWLNGSTRLSDKNWSGGPKYLRITDAVTNWHNAFVHNVGDLRRIDFIRAIPPTMDSNFGNHLPKISEIRVPIGAKAAYVTALSKAGAGIKNKSSIIIETNDFSYNV